MKAQKHIRLVATMLLYLILVVSTKVATSQCTCFASLKYRPVLVIHNIVPTGYNHAFWWVGTSTGQHYTFDGGPTGDCVTTCGLLVDWPPFGGDIGHYAEDNPSAMTTVTVGNVTPGFCNDIALMYDFAINFNNTPPAYGLRGPNSNTFAHQAATAAQLPGVPAPPATIGW